jgi:hypothetical protein
MSHGHPLASGTANYIHPTAHVHSVLPHTDHWRRGFSALSEGVHVAHPVPAVLHSHPVHGYVGSVHNPPTNSVYTGPQKDADGNELPDAPKPIPVVRAPALKRSFSHKLLETPYYSGYRSPAVAAGYASSSPMNPMGYMSPMAPVVAASFATRAFRHSHSMTSLH